VYALSINTGVIAETSVLTDFSTSNMAKNEPKSPLGPRGNDIDNPLQNLHHTLYDTSRRFDGRILPDLRTWKAKDGPVGPDYTGKIPTYELVFDYSLCGNHGALSSMILQAMTDCFGSMGSAQWELWITGDHIVDLCRELRKECEGLKAGYEKDDDLEMVRYYLRKLVTEMRRM
jgi:hypothetical protein